MLAHCARPMLMNARQILVKTVACVLHLTRTCMFAHVVVLTKVHNARLLLILVSSFMLGKKT